MTSQSAEVPHLGTLAHIASIACLGVSPSANGPGDTAWGLTLMLGPLADRIEMPLQLLRPSPSDAGIVECGRLERHHLSDFEMTGRLMLLRDRRETALRRRVRRQVTEEFLSYCD